MRLNHYQRIGLSFQVETMKASREGGMINRIGGKVVILYVNFIEKWNEKLD